MIFLCIPPSGFSIFSLPSHSTDARPFLVGSLSSLRPPPQLSWDPADRLYVGNLSPAITTVEVRSLFASVVDGPIGEIRIRTNLSDCFAFVCVADPSEAQRAIDQLQQGTFDGRVLVVARPADVREHGSGSREPFRFTAENLPWSTKTERLYELIGSATKDAWGLTLRSGATRRLAFFNGRSEESVERVLHQLATARLEGNFL
jgi:hypothetical protein